MYNTTICWRRVDQRPVRRPGDWTSVRGLYCRSGARTLIRSSYYRPGDCTIYQGPPVHRPGDCTIDLGPTVHRPGDFTIDLGPPVHRPGDCSTTNRTELYFFVLSLLRHVSFEYLDEALHLHMLSI